MSRSSRRNSRYPDGAESPSARAQTEPLAALVALFAVCAGVGLYATVLGGAMPTADRHVAGPTLERVRDAVSDDGAVRPGTFEAATAAGPARRHLNATLSVGDQWWATGPACPARADRASRVVSVRLGPGRVVPGRLAVGVWE